jgi:hypothetical protein
LAYTLKEAVSIVRKVLLAWNALDPPGRFLEHFARVSSTEAPKWVVASRRTSVLVILQCFELIRRFSWAKVTAAIDRPVVELRLEDLPTPPCTEPTEFPSAEGCLLALEGKVSVNDVEHRHESTDLADLDVVFGPGAVQNPSEGTRRCHAFVDKFSLEYEACSGLHQQRSLAREALDKWRSGLDRPCRFLVRSGIRFVVVTKDKRIIGTILSRWFVLRTKMGSAEAVTLAEEDDVEKKGAASEDGRAESWSIIVRLGIIRAAAKQDAPLSPQEQSFYNDAAAAGLTSCDPTELGISERLALFGFGRQRGLELSQQESSLLDRMSE